MGAQGERLPPALLGGQVGRLGADPVPGAALQRCPRTPAPTTGKITHFGCLADPMTGSIRWLQRGALSVENVDPVKDIDPVEAVHVATRAKTL